MFIITHNKQVVAGPMAWNKFRFEGLINDDLEELELDNVSLPVKNEPETYVKVSDSVEIWPVVGTPDPVFNSKIQMLHGPFYAFENGVASSSYEVQDLAVDAVKNMLGAVVTANRYNYEVAGVKVTIQETEVTVDTSRDGRNMFVQAYTLMAEDATVQWKFPEAWLTLTKPELGIAVQAGATHVQTQFAWESSKLIELNACTTLVELDAVVLAKDEKIKPSGAVNG